MLWKSIEVHRVATLSDEINHITQHFNKNTVFSTLIYLDEAYYFDSFNNIRKVYVRVDRNSIHILKESAAGIYVTASLKNLKFVYIYDVAPVVKSHIELCNIRLVFGCGEYETDLRLYSKKREELISTLITIRRITKDYVNEIRFLLKDLESIEKYYIVMPCEFIIYDYEVSILKEIAGLLDESKVYDDQLFQLLDEIMMNCKFSTITRVDPQLIKKINQFIPYVFKNMMVRSYEEKDRCMLVKAEMDIDTMRQICTQDQKVSSAEGFRYFKFLYSKLLNFVRLLSNSKVYFKELVLQNDVLAVL